jgi:hypothetical protein
MKNREIESVDHHLNERYVKPKKYNKRTHTRAYFRYSKKIKEIEKFLLTVGHVRWD